MILGQIDIKKTKLGQYYLVTLNTENESVQKHMIIRYCCDIEVLIIFLVIFKKYFTEVCF